MTLIHGEALEELAKLEDKSVDLILTDPPYGTTACSWDSVIDFDKMWKQLHRIIKPNGAMVLFGSEPFSSLLRVSNLKNFKYDWIWNKKHAGCFITAKFRPMQVAENIIVFGKDRINYHPIMMDREKKNIRPVNIGWKQNSQSAQSIASGKSISDKNYNKNKVFPKNLLNYSNRDNELNALNRVHPTQKPVKLLEYLIKTYTLENETILDFTMGSGSTGVACVKTNRNFIGIELDKNYFKISKKRINEASEKQERKLF